MTKYSKFDFGGTILVVFHLLGVALCLYTLGQMWQYQVLLRLLLERIPILQLLGGHILISILFALITTAAIVGVVKVLRWLRMMLRGEAIEDAAAILRIGLYVGVGSLGYCIFVLSTPESFSGPFRLRQPIAAWITTGLAYGLWCILQRLRFRFSSRTRHWVSLICLNVTVALILAEITLQIASNVWASPLLMTESTSSQLRRNAERMQPGAMRFSFPINSEGHYDTEFLPPSERSKPLVVSIGDSFSYGMVPHYYHYTTVAERDFPGAEVYNIGFPGTNPDDYFYHLVEDALPLEPDLVVIALFIGNDVITTPGNVAPTRWFDAQRYMVGIVWHRLQILRRAESNNWTQESPDTISEDLASRYPWLVDPLQEKPSMSEHIYLALETHNARISAVDHPGLYERFFAKLAQFEDAAGDIPVVFLLIPDEYQVNDELWQKVVENNDLPLQRDFAQRKIREWAQTGNHDIVDLLPLLLAEERLPDGLLHVYHLRDTHFNARGNAVAGRALAEYIEAKLTGGEKPDSLIQAPRQQDNAQFNALPDAVNEGADAIEIVRQFSTLIKDTGVDGTRVFDVSLLSHSKDEIKSALLLVLKGTTTSGQQAYFKEAAPVLAFFQPGVGAEGVSMDAPKSADQTWRDYVKTEMRGIHQDIAAQERGQ